MSGPWDKYKKQAGPWDKFQGAKSAIPGGETKRTQEEYNPPEEPGLVRTGELGDYKRAIGSALASGLTLGNSNRVLKDSKGLAESFPVLSGAANVAGSLAAGGGLAKGAGALLGRISPKLAALGGAAALKDAATGAAEGFLSDPGEGGSRTSRAIGGAAMNTALGGVGGAFGRLGKQYDIFKRLDKPFFAKEIRKEIDDASNVLVDKAVKPPLKTINSILADSKKTVRMNPEFLRGFKRDSVRGEPRKMGGLNRLADILESKAKRSIPASESKIVMGGNASPAPSSVEIPARQAQRLKQYFDRVAGYKAQRPYGKDALPIEQGAFDNASYLRGKLEEVDPRVGSINEGVSDALRSRHLIKKRADLNPIGTLTKDNINSPDRAQELLDFDAIAGTNLRKRGTDIIGAQSLKGGDTSFSRSGLFRDIFAGGKRATGAVGSKIDKLPEGSKEALVAKILEAMKKPYSEEE